MFGRCNSEVADANRCPRPLDALRCDARRVSPSYSRAHRPLFAIPFAETRDGCSFASGECTHVAPVACCCELGRLDSELVSPGAYVRFQPVGAMHLTSAQ